MVSNLDGLITDNCPAVWAHSRPPSNMLGIAEDLTNEVQQALEDDCQGRHGDQNEELQGLAQEFFRWLPRVGTQGYNEKTAYGPIQAVFVYVAHFVQHRFQRPRVEAKSYRLILPFDQTNFVMHGADDATRPDIAICSRPIDTVVEHQPNACYQDTFLIVEVKRADHFGGVVDQLGGYDLHLLRNQCDVRYPIGLTICGTVARAVIFANDRVWVSNGANIADFDGRGVLIRQLVDWSLCLPSRLGLDTSVTRRIMPTPPAVRLAAQQAARRIARQRPPATPAVRQAARYAERQAELPTMVYGVKVEDSVYYSMHCQRIPDSLIGTRTRYICASKDINSLDTPTYLIVDYWSLDGHNEAIAIGHLRHWFRGRIGLYPRIPTLVSSVQVNQLISGGRHVRDDTESAFGELTRAEGLGDDWLATQGRIHRRMVLEYPGQPISEAADQLSVVVAIGQAMAMAQALNRDHGIVHGDIRTDNIVYRIEDGMVRGTLLGLGNCIDSRTGAQRAHQLADAQPPSEQAIHVIENPRGNYTSRDYLESLLSHVCSLGTFGINWEQRAEFVAGPRLPILDWSKGTAADIADIKRVHLSEPTYFYDDILAYMRDGPLRNLASDMYRTLFRHPGTFGVKRIHNMLLAEMEDGDMAAALRALPEINNRRDPLALLYNAETIAAASTNTHHTITQNSNEAFAAQHAGAGAGA